MRSRNKKPYLLSIGIGFPLFGVWIHRYIAVRNYKDLKGISILGLKVVYTTYKRSDKV